LIEQWLLPIWYGDILIRLKYSLAWKA